MTYKGPFSNYAEWHSFTIGLYDGLSDFNPRPRSLPDNPDVQAQPHYYKGAYVIGTLILVAIIITLLNAILC